MVICTTVLVPNFTWKFHSNTSENELHTPIPKKIWQIWIHPTNQPKAKGDWGKSSNTWIDLNPGWDYIYAVMNDAAAGTYVREAFQHHRQDIVDAFTQANETIHKADFLRYLLLLQEGGVYSDLDVSCVRPVEEWIKPEWKENTGLAIGIELDDFLDVPFDPEERQLQFCQWTMMARPQHPTMQKVVDRVTERLASGEAGDVMDVTGPRVSRSDPTRKVQH